MYVLMILMQYLLISQGVSFKYLQPNLALGKQAYQSSNHTNPSRFQGPAEASRATDGNFAVNMPSNSCAHTGRDSGSWWLVDLGQNYQVTQVAITNRFDDYCSDCRDRLSDFFIGVGSIFENAAEFDPTAYNVCWYQNNSVSEGETWVFTCTEEITGRFVTIYFPTYKTQVLTLCEVQVTNSPRMSGIFSKTTPATLSLRCLVQCVLDASCTCVKLTPDGTCQLLTTDPYNDLTGVDYYFLHGTVK